MAVKVIKRKSIILKVGGRTFRCREVIEEIVADPVIVDLTLLPQRSTSRRRSPSFSHYSPTSPDYGMMSPGWQSPAMCPAPELPPYRPEQ